MHVSKFLYMPLVTIHIVAMVYIVGVDRGGWSDQYAKIANVIIVIALFIEIMIAIYNRIKYGPKNQGFKDDTKTGIISVILIIVIVAAMYLSSE